MIIKKCQIHAVSPITCFTVPIIGTTELNLTSDEIYKCLCAKAEVMEILENGKMINLDFTNYNRDNSIIGEPEVIKEDSISVIEETPIIEETSEPEPVVEKETSAETVEEIVESETTEETTSEAEEVESSDETKSSNEDHTVKEYKNDNRNKKNKKK